jgi:hypothetical protein
MSKKQKKFTKSWAHVVFIYLARLLFALNFLAVFVPFYPIMPKSGLDPSWKLGTNQATAQKLSFGSDVIFTFGPYASIYTRVYHPATDRPMMWGSFLIGISYVMMIIILAKKNHPFWLIIFSLLLPIVYLVDNYFYALDAILFSYPVALALVVYRLSNPISIHHKIEPSMLTLAIILLAFFSLGILPLIKGTLLIMVGSIVCLSAILLWMSHQRRMGIIAILVPLISMFLFWLLAGQKWHTLPSYLKNINQLVSGYTDAMSIKGDWNDIVIFVSAGFFVLLVIFLEKPFSLRNHTYLTTVFAVAIFLGYKAGFVRHDSHALIAAETIFFIGSFLPLVLKNKMVLPAFLLAITVWFDISSNINIHAYQQLYSRIPTVYINAWDGIRVRLMHPDRLRQNFGLSMLEIHNELPLPKFLGTTDIYSFNQSYLLASENTWSPRPILQSYAAYNSTFLQLNESYLRNKNAPDNLLFQIETIDGRFPALDDGMSWPTIINYYHMNGFVGPLIHFQRRISVLGKASPPIQPDVISSATHYLDETVEIPYLETPLFAEINIKPTLLGKIVSVVYKLPEMRMTLTLANGDKKDYRIIPTMMSTPFLIFVCSRRTISIMNYLQFVALHYT